jgi:hypothetical protein
MSYTRVLKQDGDLAGPAGANAIGIDFGFASRDYARNHLSLAHQWEGSGPTAAKGFRIDLIAVGFPIAVNPASLVRVHIEPLLTLARGEIMFATGGQKLLRIESGFTILVTVMYQRWFLGVEPLAVDFRYYVARTIGPSESGFTRVIPLRFSVGREF